MKVRDEHGSRNGKIYDWRIGLKPRQDYGCRCLAIFVDSIGRPTGNVARSKYNKETMTFEEEERNFISSQYGEDRGNGKTHSGIDFAVSEGTVVRATKGGVVKRSGWQNDNHSIGYGFRIQVLNDDRTYSDYGHLKKDSILFKEGERVETG